jgi:hypothetical protein
MYDMPEVSEVYSLHFYVTYVCTFDSRSVIESKNL